MKILLTGGTGYIGSHTAVELLLAGHEVVIFDNLSNSKRSVVQTIAKLAGRKPRFIQGDIRDRAALDRLLAAEKVEAVIHFAGKKAVAESVEQPLEYYENNVGGTLCLLQAMQAVGVRRIVFSSSATVYGDQVVPYHEEAPTGRSLANPYGRTKYMVEEMLKDLAASDAGWQVTLLRYFNPAGCHPSGLLGEDPNDRPNNLLPVLMNVVRGKQSELLIFGDDYPTPDGTCIRDYIHVVDLARGHLAALSQQAPGVTVYNLGTGKGQSVREVIESYERLSGHKLSQRVAPRRAGDLAEYYATAEKARRELGWEATLSLDEMMRDTLKYLGL